MRSLLFQQNRRFSAIQLRQWRDFGLQLGSRLRESLEGRGLQQQAQEILGLALDLTKPYLQGLGFRVAKLSPELIELIIPQKALLAGANGGLDEGLDPAILCQAATYALNLLWLRSAHPQISARLWIRKLECEQIRPAVGNQRLTLTHSTILMESLRLALQQHGAPLEDKEPLRAQWTAQVFDQQESLTAKIEITAELRVLEKVTELPGPVSSNHSE